MRVPVVSFYHVTLHFGKMAGYGLYQKTMVISSSTCIRRAVRCGASTACFSTSKFLLMCSATNHSKPPEYPVIKLPAYIENALKRKQAKEEKKKLEMIRRKSCEGDKSVPIITCKKPELNFFLHQTYPKYEEVPLASKGWKHRKANGDHFTIHPFGKNPAMSEEYYDNNEVTPTGFSVFKLSERLNDALDALGLKHPTVIQRKAIPVIARGSNVICNSETGSGKTLAYLIPVFNRLLKKQTSDPAPRSPQCLILVPSRELAEQVYGIGKKLGGYCGISMRVIASGISIKDVESYSNHVLIGTVGALSKAVTWGGYSLSQVRHVIVDEADTMTDDSFSDDLAFFLQKLVFHGSNSYGAQLILVSATFPKYLPEVLKDIVNVNSMVHISTENLHRLLPHIKQKFFRLAKSAKPGKLLEIVKTEVHRKRPIMIFSNSSPTCDWISLFLNENGVPAINLHSSMPDKIRLGRFRQFVEGEFNVISCTDLASRGLDTVRLQHVLNYDFPLFMSDYVHRIGRTGRVGSPENCCASNFVTAGNTALVQKIELAARQVQALTSVDANIKRKLFERELRGTAKMINSL